MKEATRCIIPILAIGFLVAGFCAGVKSGRQEIQRQAIEQGVAFYHPETRVFTWGQLNVGIRGETP